MTTPTSSATPDPHPNERARPLLEVAYLYEPYWNQHSSDWVKSLLLFFDGIALLVPDYMRDRPLFRDPALAQPLDDQGLLHRLSPDTLVDQTTTEGLIELLDDLLRAGAFDQLSSSDGFTELSYSRLGGLVDAGLTEVVLEQLRERGLAKPSEDGVSIPLNPAVRALVLVVLPQLLRAPAESAGYALQPTGAQTGTARALMATLDQAPLPSAGQVVAADLDQVTLDLGTIPLDEVLDYRRQHGAQHRAYARDLRHLVRDLSLLESEQRDEALRDRREATRRHRRQPASTRPYQLASPAGQLRSRARRQRGRHRRRQLARRRHHCRQRPARLPPTSGSRQCLHLPLPGSGPSLKQTTLIPRQSPIAGPHCVALRAVAHASKWHGLRGVL